MDITYEVETAILQHLDEQKSCTIEKLSLALSRFTFNQVFSAIDRLSRDGRISLRHPTRFTYLVLAAGAGTHNQVSPSTDQSGVRRVRGSVGSPM